MPGIEASDRPGGGTFSAEEQMANTARELNADSPERVAEENARLASELHTLLVSFAPGPGREQMLVQFPEVGGEASVGSALELDEPDGLEKRAKLQGLMDRAVQAIGGRERADMVLKYPGLTDDEDFSKVRPARADWLETEIEVNKAAPQMPTGIATKVGRHMLRDIAAGKASWEDVIYGYLDNEQIGTQKDLVAKLHHAFRSSPAMPEGHSHANMAYRIPDARFGHLWREVVQNVVEVGQYLADWAEQTEGTALPLAERVSDEEEATAIDASNVARLTALTSDPRYRPYVETFLSLYEAAAEALDSPEGLELLKDYRQQLNTRRPRGGASGDGDDKMVSKLVRKAIGDRVDQIVASGTGPALPPRLEDHFGGFLDGNMPDESGPIDAYVPEADPWL